MITEDFRPYPIDEEPILSNRYAAYFPEETGVDCFHVQSVSAMVFDFRKGAWKDIVICVREVISYGGDYAKLMAYYAAGKCEPILVKMLDGPGVCVQEASIDAYEVLEIARPDLVYGKDQLFVTTLTLRPKTISIGYGDQKVTYSSKGQ